MNQPAFWARDGVLPRLLSPLSAVYATATARRVAQPGWDAPVPVICCGNAGVGGSGKTPVALDLGRRLIARGRRPAFLSRGYGGRGAGVLRAEDDTADEPRLLAEVAPCWLGPDRAASARVAVAAGADVLVMDDGLQNPTLHKSLSLLVVDAAVGFGNGRVLPAGSLREPAGVAAARCAAMVLIGDGLVPPLDLPLLRARLVPQKAARFAGRRMAAFAGIGRPAKFWESLRDAGVHLIDARPFPDHHAYSDRDLAGLPRGVALVTTAKDAVRLPPGWRDRVEVFHVDLAWDEPAGIEALLDRVL